MHRSTVKRNETKRLDALLAMPLDRYRRALTRLSADEMAALEVRLAAQRMKHRLARGGFGIERHRAVHELALLARRESALRSQREKRIAAAPALIQLVFPEAAVADVTADVGERRAA